MEKAVLCWTALAVVLGAPSEARSQPAGVGLSPQEEVLLEEVQHLTATLAPALWADWPGRFPPFMLRTRGRDVLIGHPEPPGDFAPLTLEHGVWTRITKDSTDVQASFPLNGVVTAVMSVPSADDDPCAWILKAAHEVFHCYQGRARTRDPFVGKFAAYNDLSFPYPYEDPSQTAALRLEAEFVFRLATADSNDTTPLVTHAQLLRLVWRLQRALASEPAIQDYKLSTEWSEGVARYTERELARLAAIPGRYQPTPAFAQTFPQASYDSVYRHRYGDDSMVNPIRFVGEGVRGRVMFYYLGMGKAYALDRINPLWRTAYRRHTLDELLDVGIAQLSR